MNTLRKPGLLCQLPDTLRILDAAKYIASNYWAGMYRLRPKLLLRAVALRGRTSDAVCFKKVFVH
jgi:hypothetical protein